MHAAATSLTMLQKFPKEILELIAKQVCQSHSKDISLMLTFQLSDVGSYRNLKNMRSIQTPLPGFASVFVTLTLT
jgi:hypothetical protein